MKPKFSFVSFCFTLSLLFLTYLFAQYSAWRSIYPFEPHLREAFVGLEALYLQHLQERQPYRTDVWMPASLRQEGQVGVTAHDAERAFAGYTLLAVGQSAVLIDMEGRPLHRWQLPYARLMDAAAGAARPPPETWLYWKPVRLLAGGALLAVVDLTDVSPNGLALVKLDRDSEVLWAHHRHVHHDFDVGRDGRIYVLDQAIRHEALDGLPAVVPPFLDEGVVVLSPGGEVLRRVSIIDAFAGSPYRGLLDEFAERNQKRWGDYLHSNNVDVIEDAAPGAPGPFRPGRVLLSFREISTIAVLDLEEARIVWAARGPWHRQHDPDLLEDGDILLFDNRGDWSRGGKSRVLKFDPVTREIVWRYPAEGEDGLWSAYRAEQQRLPNGNVLINEFEKGRLLEVDQAGDIVWEYYCPFRREANEDYICRVMYAERYAASVIDFQFSPPQVAERD